MDDLSAMRKASRPSSGDCAACETEDLMTPEHRATFREAMVTRGITTSGLVWWLKEKGYWREQGLGSLQSPEKSLRNHRTKHLD